MSRKKPKIVGEVDLTRYGVKIPIYLNPDDLTFQAKVGETILVEKTAEVLELRIYAVAKETFELIWFPAIEVEEFTVFGPDDYVVGFDIERLYLAQRKNGAVARVEWQVPPELRVSHAMAFHWRREWGEIVLPLSKPKGTPGHERYYLLPYAEETWRGLVQMRAAIKELKGRLRDMLATPEGNLFLQKAGGYLLGLPAPEGNEKDK